MGTLHSLAVGALIVGGFVLGVVVLALVAGRACRPATRTGAPMHCSSDDTTAYLAAVYADEMTLARLLGHGDLCPPIEPAPNGWIWGTSHGERGSAARLARGPLPRWRRDWSGAGPLIGRCGLHVHCNDATVSVYIGPPTVDDVEYCATYSNFLTKDDAIRYAICKAAIAHLTALATK